MSIYHQRYVTLRQHLKQMRRDADLTQVEIAQRLGLDQSYISKIERGERYVDALFFIDWCTACGVPADLAMQLLCEKLPK